MPQQALEAAMEQLAYWQKEREAAASADDSTRLAQCQRFVVQCERMVSILTEVAKQK
jgi:hypothetical protein